MKKLREQRQFDRPKVLMVTNMWPSEDRPVWGIFVFRQVQSLRDKGFDISVMFVDGRSGRLAYLKGALRMFLKNFQRSGPSLVHVHGGETALVARMFVRAPVMVSYCGSDLLGATGADGSVPLGRKIRSYVLRFHACLMTRTITKSEEMENLIPRFRRNDNQVIPNGIDRDLFQPRDRTEARNELGWRADEKVVLFAANPEVERKGYPLAKTACEIAAETVGDVRLHVAWGTDPGDMPRLMAASDCLLLASGAEGSPNVVKESVTCGLPVITSNVGDVNLLLRDVTPSWIVGRDPQSFASSLVEYFSDPTRSNGFEKSEWLDEELIADRVLAIYRHLAPDLAKNVQP